MSAKKSVGIIIQVVLTTPEIAMNIFKKKRKTWFLSPLTFYI